MGLVYLGLVGSLGGWAGWLRSNWVRMAGPGRVGSVCLLDCLVSVFLFFFLFSFLCLFVVSFLICCLVPFVSRLVVCFVFSVGRLPDWWVEENEAETAQKGST